LQVGKKKFILKILERKNQEVQGARKEVLSKGAAALSRTTLGRATLSISKMRPSALKAALNSVLLC
jgi:hypothetical protein